MGLIVIIALGVVLGFVIIKAFSGMLSGLDTVGRYITPKDPRGRFIFVLFCLVVLAALFFGHPQ
jgi:hypothetical protein